MNDLETFEPELTKIGKENPFRVPDGYFESLPTRVHNYCNEDSAKNPFVKRIVVIRTQLAFAAGLCIFILIAFVGYHYSQQTNSISSLKKVDYIKIVEESGTEFDEIQLYEVFSNGHKKDSIKNSMNDELIEYLLYDNINNGTHLDHSKDIKP
ncbi:MAG: hypothetical protein HXX16_09695 [Bacteroidales bacterium]|nr:hypothetical protein [Bacteroidales bacterium]